MSNEMKMPLRLTESITIDLSRLKDAYKAYDNSVDPKRFYCAVILRRNDPDDGAEDVMRIYDTAGQEAFESIEGLKG